MPHKIRHPMRRGTECTAAFRGLLDARFSALCTGSFPQSFRFESTREEHIPLAIFSRPALETSPESPRTIWRQLVQSKDHGLSILAAFRVVGVWRSIGGKVLPIIIARLKNRKIHMVVAVVLGASVYAYEKTPPPMWWKPSLFLKKGNMLFRNSGVSSTQSIVSIRYSSGTRKPNSWKKSARVTRSMIRLMRRFSVVNAGIGPV